MNTGSPGAPEGLFHVTFPESLLDLDSEWIKDIKIDLNLGTNSILDLLDMINYLATVNYYVEAISGSVNTAAGATTAGNVAGTIAALFVANEVRAAIGDNASLTLGQNGGDSLVMSAESGANTRVIAGSASIGAAKAGVGAVVSLASLADQVAAAVGNAAKVTALGDIAVSAAAEGEVWDVSVADATALDASNFVSVGGGVNVVLSEVEALASVGDGANVATDGAFAIDGDNHVQTVLIAANVGMATGNTTAAAGGTVSFASFANRTGARLGDLATVRAASIALAADSSEKVIIVLASASGAPQSSANIAATVSTFLNESETVALAGAGVNLTATAADILVHAFDESTAVVALLSLAAGGNATAALGATVLTHIFEQQAIASVGISENAGVADAATLVAQKGSILVEADAKNLSVSAGAALTATGQSTLSFADTVITNLFSSQGIARMGDNTNATAYDSIGVVADGDNRIVNGAGTIGATGANTAGIGASVGTLLVENTIEATVGRNGALTAYALNTAANAGILTANRAERRRGVVVHAFSDEEIYMAAVGGSIAGSGMAVVSGVVDTLLVRNKVIAQVGENTAVSAGLNAAEGLDADGDGETDDSDGEGEIAVEAHDETFALNFGGALSASGSSTVAFGATVVTISFEKQVSAILDGGSQIVHAEGDIHVTADNQDTLFLLAVTAGATGGTAGVSLGGNILLFDDLVQAHLGGDVRANGDVTVQADSEVELYNIGMSVAGASTAGVGGVAIVTYFTGTTEALLLSGSSLVAGGALAILANSREFVTADGAGISGGGTAGVSGTVDAIITKLTTRAEVEDNASGVRPVLEAASITIQAHDDYQLVGVAASAALAGTAGVGITAIVTIAKNTVSAGIGDNYAVTTALADVLIDALSKRDVHTYAGTVGIGGTGGVGAVLMATIVGGKLDQDSAEALEAYFDADALINGADGQTGMKDSVPGVAKSVYEGEGMSLSDQIRDDLSGNGNRYSGISVGTTEQKKNDSGQPLYYDASGNETTTDTGNPVYITVFDGNDQYLSEDFERDYSIDTSNPDQTAPGQPGADLVIGELDEDDSDRGDAAAILDGFTKPASTDATSAFIGRNTTVDSAGDISVVAQDVLHASLVTASVAGGSAAGVGVGMAVAILNSNVVACTEEGSALSANGDITVYAYAGSPSLTDDALSEDDKAANDFLNREENGDFAISDLTIHAISVSGAIGGTAGVGVAVAVVTLGTNAIATVGGSVEDAATLTVRAVSDYANIVAATLSVGGGFVGVDASAAAVTYEGTTRASIEGTGRILGVGTVTLETIASGSVAVAAAGLAGGAVAVNAGVAVALNRSLVETFIAQGVTVGSGNKATAPNLNLLSTVTSNARAFTVGVTGGAVAVGAAVAVVILEPTVHTYLGAAPGTSAGGDPAVRGEIAANQITITNDITTEAASYAARITGGAIAVTPQVLLVFNRTDAYAGINRINVEAAGKIAIDGYLDANAKSYVAQLTGAAVAVGVVVTYVLLDSTNLAEIDLTGSTVQAASVDLFTGREGDKNQATAEALAVAANAGAVSVGLNAAVADNYTKNIARILGGDADTLLVTGALNLGAYGMATANAQVWGVSAGAISVLGSAAVALVRNEQRALVEGGSITAGSLSAISSLNQDLSGMQYVDAAGVPGAGNVLQDTLDGDSGKAAVFAGLITGNGGAIAVTADVAVAYGRAVSLANILPHSLQITGNGSVNVSSVGSANVLSQSLNQSLGAITATVIVNVAYSQSDIFNTRSSVAGGSAQADTVTISTDYIASAKAVVAPSAGGVSGEVVGLKVNLAIANAGSTARAAITGSGSLTANAINVLANGVALSEAYNITPVLSGSGIMVAANVLVALLDAQNSAYIQDVAITGAAVTVHATLNNGDNQGAKAKLGNSVQGSTSITLLGVGANVAVALDRAVNHAYLDCVALTDGKTVSIQADGKSYAVVTVDEATVDINLVSIGVNVTVARADGDFRAYILTGEGQTVRAVLVTVENNYESYAYAESRQPAVGVGAATVDTNVAYADAGTLAYGYIGGNGSVIAINDLQVAVDGLAESIAQVLGTQVTVAGATVAANVATAIVSADQQAFIGDAQGAAQTSDVTVQSVDGGITVSSSFNRSSLIGSQGAEATVGSNYSVGVDITLVDVNSSTSTARMEATATAHIRTLGDILAARALNVNLSASSTAVADIWTPEVSVNAVNVTVLVSNAEAKGAFYAYAEASTLEAGSLSITNDYSSRGEAATGSAGGVSVDLASEESNVANANVNTAAKAYLKTTVEALIMDAATINASGTVSAWAEGRLREVGISGLKVAVNVIKAVLAADQEAYVQSDGTMFVGRALTVQSLIDGSGANAENGASGGKDGVSVSLIGVTVNKATAESSTKNSATLSGSGTIQANSVNVLAKSTTEANATVDSGVKVSIVAVGGRESYANTQDSVSAGMTGIQLTTAGDTVVEAIGNTASNAVSTAEGGGGGVSVAYVRAQASVGKSGEERQSVHVTVDGTKVVAGGDIELRVYNEGAALANIVRGTNISLGAVDVEELPTYGWYATGVDVKGQAELISENGNVNILSEDDMSGESVARGTTIGIGFNVSTTYGRNEAYGTNTINVDGILDAYASLIVKAASRANLKAETYADGGGLISGVGLKATNKLERTRCREPPAGEQPQRQLWRRGYPRYGGRRGHHRDDLQDHVRRPGGGGHGQRRYPTDVQRDRQPGGGRRDPRPLQYAQRQSGSFAERRQHDRQRRCLRPWRTPAHFGAGDDQPYRAYEREGHGGRSGDSGSDGSVPHRPCGGARHLHLHLFQGLGPGREYRRHERADHQHGCAGQRAERGHHRARRHDDLCLDRSDIS